MSNYIIDDELISDITYKLSLDANCKTSITIDNEEEEDDDISMRDYTDEDIIPTHNQHEDYGMHYRCSNDRVDNEIQEQNDNEDNKASNKFNFGNILSPESQGYALSQVINGKSNGDKDIIRKEDLKMFDDKNIVIHNHFYNINTGDGITRRYNSSNHQMITNNEHNKNEYDDDYEYNADDIKNEVSHRNNITIFEQLKKSINYSIILIIGYHVLQTIREDFRIEYDKLNVRLELQKDQCFREYTLNKCSEYGQLPALKEECLEWEICFNNGQSNQYKSMIYSELIFHVISRVLNNTLNNIGGMNKIYLLGCLLIWYMGNFMFGYFKGSKLR